MLITRRSRITGTEHTLDLPVTIEQMAAFDSGIAAQDAFPDLSAPLREFILSGITPDEWKQHVVPPDAKDDTEDQE